jgi:prepilin-type N-terminal cleavage/methylation domain-containing protein
MIKQSTRNQGDSNWMVEKTNYFIFGVALYKDVMNGLGMYEMTSSLKIKPFAQGNRGFTLVEALVATVIMAMVASAASVGIGLSVATQQDARLAQLATQAAKQQVDFLMEKPFASMADSVGMAVSSNTVTEEVGQLKAPPAAGGVDRTLTLGGEWAKLGRRTTLTNEPTTFTNYNNFLVEGMSISVEVFGPDGTIYATLRRHRTNEAPL